MPENPARSFREALRIMEDKRYGKIVNISSIAGISGLTAHNSAYSAAKAGVVGFTKAAAIEVIGANVNVNCIAAGGITTPGLQKMVDSSPQMRERMVQAIPQGRLGEVDEYASLALYLASDDAAYMVGQILSPNGGCVV
ncbi:MAG: SDR family oxidoreductase [Burkholderiaceae bacterium]